MRNSDWKRPSRRSAFFLVLLAAAGLLAVPRSVRSLARTVLGTVLRPGQTAGQEATRAVIAFGQRLAAPPNDPVQLQRLRDQVRDLRVALIAARSQGARRVREFDPPPGSARPPLLRPALLSAMVIGHDAASLLRHERLLAPGTGAGLHAGALVLGPTTIDEGQNMGLRRGQMAFLGRSVVGRIREAATYTSTLQLITDPGFRKLVEVWCVRGTQLRPGPRGILVGTGRGRCRLTRMAAGEDVRVGDWVMTTGYQALLPYGLAYGRIETCTRNDDDQLYWDIVVKPNVDLTRLGRVFVLTAKISRDRLAAADQERMR